MSYFRVLIASIRVGWNRDFSWTNPIAGFSLRTLAPVASTMTATTILFLGISKGGTIPLSQLPSLPLLIGYILIGATLYAHIAAYAWVPTLAIAEGKWSYVFPQVYVSPRSSPPYLAGRCIASFCTSTVTSVASLIAASLIWSLVFGTAIPFIVTPVSIALLALAFVVNILASMGLGFLLGAYTIFASKFEWALPTYVAGLLMVFSEALFPVSYLGHPFSDIGNILPFTQFIRAARAIMLPQLGGGLMQFFYYLGLSFVGGAIMLALGLLAFRFAEHKARREGVLDRKVV